jgi:hypothetical protein
VPRGLEDDGAGLVIRAELRPAPAALQLGLVALIPALLIQTLLRNCHAVRAMLLDDACHSIDSPNMRSILENVKFPNYPRIGRKRISVF